MSVQPRESIVDASLEQVAQLAQQLRADSIRCSTAAGSGHPTSSLSAADLMAVLLARHLRYDWSRPKSAGNDYLIFSKGHASPLLYAMFKAAGVIDDDELIGTYRRLGARLQGHPTPVLPWVDVATGSLGQGIGYAAGVALAGTRLDHLPFRVWTLCGDSEMAEGSVWEALDKAGIYRLTNLTVIVDVNRLGQRGPTEFGWDLDVYKRRVEAFGCRAIELDGHDLEAIDAAFASTGDAIAPTVLLARTVKGKGVPEVEDQEGWHGRALPADLAQRAVAALGGAGHLTVTSPAPAEVPERPSVIATDVAVPTYEVGAKVATRKAFGEALAALGARPDVVVVDGEVGNSTHAEEFAKRDPERYFEMYISEQMMVAGAVGLAIRGYRAFAATFAAFFSRAYDFVRMAGISGIAIKLCGSHAGVEIGEDGPSQMGLEDIAAMRAVQGSTVLYPSDATSAAALTVAMADLPGVCYLRTTRGAYPVLYPASETFPIGGSKTLRQSDDDEVALIGAGVTVHNCLDAAEKLATNGVSCRVIDLYSVKPVDSASLDEAVRATGGKLVVVEDHHPEGGLGAAVLEAMANRPRPPQVAHLAVRELPGSGKPVELMDAAGIGPGAIVEAALALTGK
jgi:transketolase